MYGCVCLAALYLWHVNNLGRIYADFLSIFDADVAVYQKRVTLMAHDQ